MATIKINELPTSSINSTDFLVKADGNGLATKNTIENLLSSVADLNGNSSELFEVSNGLSGNDAVNVTQLDIIENELFDKIQDEEGDRQSADTTLQENIDAEVITRSDADTTLQSNIDLKIDIASIVDNVTAGGSGVPLSAEQGKILKAEIIALAGSLIPQGNWDADTNTPDISGTTETGYFWIVSVEGATDIGGITDWKVNDWVIKTADGFAKIDNTDKVLSVAGKIGEVVLGIADITSLQSGLNLKANLSGGNTFEGSQILNNSDAGSKNKIIINNSINDSGLEVNNTDDNGFGLNINNTSTGIGSRTVNEIGGIGSFFVNNQDSFTEGNAIEILNKGLGNSIFINNKTSGNGFVSNASDSETTGLNFIGQNETVNTFTVDKEGNIVANKANLLGNLTVSSSESTIGNGNGSRVISLIDSSLGDDMGGLQIITGDSNNDEPALLHTNYLGDEAFRISSFGDIISTRGATFGGAVIGLSFSGDGSLLTNMPVSSAQQTALDLKSNKASPVFSGNAIFGSNLEIKGSFADSGSDPKLRIINTDTTLGDSQIIGDIEFYQADISGDGEGVVSRIRSINSSNFKGQADLIFETGTTSTLAERLRIDYLGNATFGGNVEFKKDGVNDVLLLKFKNAFDTGYIKSSYTDPNTSTETYISFSANVHGATNGTVAEGMRLSGSDLKVLGEFEAVGNATFGGNVVSSGSISSGTGQNTSNNFTVDNNQNNISRLYSNGKDTSTNGEFEFYTTRSNGTNQITALKINGVGNATFGGSVQADSYKSSDGTVGLTTTFTISGTSYTYKNGLLTGVFSA